MKITATLALLALVLSVTSAQAQRRFTLGPRVGLSQTGAQASFYRADHTFQPTTRLGWEAGVQGNVALGHVALQPALLYAQRGFKLDESYGPSVTFSSPTLIRERYRYNYLTLPLNVAYTQHADGTGFQAFVGGYMGLLLGGSYAVDNSYAMFPSGSSSQQQQGKIRARTKARGSDGPATENRYASPWDAGLQAGVGYRLGGALLQLSYSWGLQYLRTQQVYTTTADTYEVARHRNSALQASVIYFLNYKS